MTYLDIIREIEHLPLYKPVTCTKCGHTQEVYILDIYSTCEECQNKSKVRGFASIGTEIEDIIDVVIDWLDGINNHYTDKDINDKKE